MNQARALYGNRWIRFGLTFALLMLVLARVEPQRIAAAIGSAHPAYLLIALVLTAPFLYLKSLRWHIMLRTAGIDATFAEAVLSLVGGMGLALITPARLGELVRIAYLRDKQKLKIAGLVLIDKGFDVLVLCALSIVGAFALFGFWAGLGLAIVTVVGVAAVYRPVAWSRSLNAISSRTPLALHLNRTWSSLQSLTPWTTSLYLALTLLSFAIVLLQFGIVLLSWHAWSPSIVFLTFPMVVLTNVLPLTIGGLGIREGAAAVLLGHYGVSPADAALAAFLMFAMNTALPGIVGALLLPALPAGEQSRVVQSLDRP